MPQIFFNINDYLFNTNDCIYLLEIISPAIEDWGMVGGKKKTLKSQIVQGRPHSSSSLRREMEFVKTENTSSRKKERDYIWANFLLLC